MVETYYLTNAETPFSSSYFRSSLFILFFPCSTSFHVCHASVRQLLRSTYTAENLEYFDKQYTLSNGNMSSVEEICH